MQLRYYQQNTMNALYGWFQQNPEGNPCLVLPTGAGKSVIIAEFVKSALQNYPETRVLMLTHVKELIEQNASKLRAMWPNAPMGIYSASLRSKDLSQPITFAGIQSIRNKAQQVGHIDLILIDECHLVGHKDEGGYRDFIADLTAINPNLRIIGLTATPYRLGHGLITHKPALFDALIEPVDIEELIAKGYLATLRSKVTDILLEVDSVKKRGGEFVERELQQAVDTEAYNEGIVDEVIELAGDRKAWLFFCAGVDHAQHIADCLTARGIAAACVTGKTSKLERERILSEFKLGKIKAVTNANVLTTGFDYPDIDLIAMLRPTLSPALYVQMAGRGLRPKSHTDHCLVLDFAGVVRTHGPITAVIPPKKKGKKEGGEAPVKVCDNCDELVHLSAKTCPACGFEFPPPERPALDLQDDDIMGYRGIELDCNGWKWQQHTSRSSGKAMIKITYYGANLSDKPVIEYLPLLHGGYAAQKASVLLGQLAQNSGADINRSESVDDATKWLSTICEAMNSSANPQMVEYRRDGKFDRIIKREWNEQ